MKIMKKKSNRTTCEALFPLLVTFSTKRGGVFRSKNDLATIITIILINTDSLTMKVVYCGQNSKSHGGSEASLSQVIFLSKCD